MRKKRLFTPGPTPLLPEAQLAMTRPIIYHRTKEFKDLFSEARGNLQRIFKTKNEVLILTSSGTGAMEAAVCNLLSTQEQALAVVAGKFGERWIEICRAFQIPCTPLCKEYGTAASAEEICSVLGGQPKTSALLLQGCETSTATSLDLQGIAKRVHEEFPATLIVVDAITALGSQPVETDQWGLDVVVAGSQKHFSIPPGLAFLSLSQRALERIHSKGRTVPRFYFDLRKELKHQHQGQSAYTPALSLVMALTEATRQILAEGLDQILIETERMARCTRRGLLALDFRLLSSAPASALTAAFPPDGISASELVERLEVRFGVQVAGGQGKLKGKIIRIAHVGNFDLLDVFSILSALELCLVEIGGQLELGIGVQAALKEATERGN